MNMENLGKTENKGKPHGLKLCFFRRVVYNKVSRNGAASVCRPQNAPACVQKLRGGPEGKRRGTFMQSADP